jgi:cell division transport system ATP-binding protein
MGGTTSGEPAVAIKNCTFAYASGRRVLENLTWWLSPGDFAVLSGPTGAGKSTLIRLLIRLALPDSGELYVLGEDLVRLPARARPALRRRIGVVGQELSLLGDRSVEQNLRLALAVRGKRGEAAARRVAQLLQEGGLLHRRHDLPTQLSGGERQRLAVARAAAGFPDLVLADEPTAHLDLENAAAVKGALSRLQTAGATVIVATHSPAHFAAVPGARFFRLERGQVNEASA